MIYQNTDDLSEEMELLESKIESESDPANKTKLKKLLANYQKGLAAERRASFEIQKALPYEAAVINSLFIRTEIDGRPRTAQIDHLAITPDGDYILFETKHYSTGVKVTPTGTFLYWHPHKRKYLPISSPVQQSKFHEDVLISLLDSKDIFYRNIHHVVVIFYGQKLIKPKTGFENVLGPSEVIPYVESLQKKDLLTRFKNRFIKPEGSNPRLIAHQLLNIDYGEKPDYTSRFS